MLPGFYHKCMEKLLTPRQYATLRIVVLLLQNYRTIQIEKLASLLPIPLKYQSRRRHLQRFLMLPKLTPKCIWFPIIKKWLKINQTNKRICYVAIDRTRWKERNLFVVSLIKNKRGIPLHWILLNKKGNSNIAEQKRLLKSTLRLLKGYQVVIIGDREFGNINLADWLSKRNCKYVLRTKNNKYIQEKGKDYQQLKSLGLAPGNSSYYKQVKFTKQPGMSRVNREHPISEEKQKK
ncbi:transposase [Pleurocapsa sp. PCC 7319]|uniref:transposase n=2 Tax=Pleurocapsa sp. PCC 7319 TaxID=118161 RepID=UPI001181B6AC|nr:transposase [Pleurocapsa sp. PCC 7319]